MHRCFTTFFKPLPLLALAVLFATVITDLSHQIPADAAAVPSAPVIGGSIRIVADNDFALLAGDENNVTRMILQNDVVWNSQQTNATTYQINLNSGETYFYLLAMGGGGGESIGGLLNEVDITTITSGVNGIQRAVSRTGGTTQSDFLLIDTFFSDWSSVGFSGNSATNVENGKYSAPIVGIQTALTGATWGNPPTRISGGIGGSVTGFGYVTPSSRAVMFRFKSTSLGEGFVSAGENSANVSWQSPTSDGGSSVLDYTVTAYNASTNIATGNVCTTPNGTTRACTVTGLTNGVAYYFKISARNAMGSGPLSLATQSVIPLDVTPPTLTLASLSASRSTNNPVFTVTGNEGIDCSTLSSTAGQDFTVVGGTISSITQQSLTTCAITVSTTVAASSSTTVTVTKASTFSMTDTTGNAATTLIGSPASTVVSVPAPTTTTTSTTTTTTTTSTTTTTTTTVPPTTATTTAPVDLEIVVRIPTGQVNTTVMPMGQIAIPKVSSVSPRTASPMVSATTTTMSTTTTLGTTTSTLPAVKSSTAVAPKIPSLDTGEAAVTSGGKKVSTRLSRANNQIVIQAAGITTTINGLSKSGAPVPLNKDGNVPLQGGSRVRVFAEGLKPNTSVEAWLFSSPTWLGIAKADEKGTLSQIFTLPKDAKSGLHRIALNAITAAGDEVSIALGVVLGDKEIGRNTAPWLIAIPIGLAMAVAFFLPVAHRRRRKEEVKTL